MAPEGSSHEASPMPEWARRWRDTGELPEFGSDDFNDWFAWWLLQQDIPGLPAATSFEGIDIGRRALACKGYFDSHRGDSDGDGN